MADTYQIKQGDTLGKIAQQYGTDAGSLAKANNIANPNLIQAGGTLNIPNVQPIVSAGQLGNTSPINLPPAPVTTDLNALVASFAPQVTEASTGQKTAETAVNTDTSALLNLSRQLEGQQADTFKAEQDAGLPAISADLLELQNQSRQKSLEYANAYTAAEANNIGRGVTTGLVRGEAALRQRQAAVDIALINSNIQAKQGQLALAQSTVDRAIAAKYEPLKARIETQKFILNQSYENLSRADKKLADARSSELSLKMKQIERDEEEDKAKQNIIIDAASQGAPNTVIAQAQKAKTPAEAAAILGKYSSAFLDRKYKLAQIENIYSEIEKRNAEAVKADNLANFVTPPMVNPQTGKTDPVSQLTSVINATGAKDNVKFQDILGVITSTQQLAENNLDGKFKGLSVLPRLTPGFAQSQEQITNKGSIEAINLKVQQWASGAALTDAQTKQVKKFTPRKGDSDNEVKKKLNNLTNFMLSQAQSQLAAQGINYQPKTVDYFASPMSSMSNDELLNMLPSTSNATNNQSFFENF